MKLFFTGITSLTFTFVTALSIESSTDESQHSIDHTFTESSSQLTKRAGTSSFDLTDYIKSVFLRKIELD